MGYAHQLERWYVDTSTAILTSGGHSPPYELTIKEIEAYVKSGETIDKAGAYAIQGLGSVIIRRIEGDYFNVIGLPVCALIQDLKKFGVNT